MQTVLVVLGAYLIGSISFAIVVSRLMRLPDPRSYGSGNPGATNVLRTGRKAAAALTLLGDAGKGWLAVWLAATLMAPGADPVVAGGAPESVSDVTVALTGVAVFLGHLFPLYHGFKGGKGVATAAGVLLGFDAWLGLATITTWIVIALLFRMSSLAALLAAAFAPCYAVWLFGVRPVLPAVLAIAALLVWRHAPNIARIAAGTEPRLGAAKRDSVDNVRG
jgi:glycerol-3-phosphate acyltransferase PlsY